MASLARSLLALALVALLQAVSAIFPPPDLFRRPRCTKVLFGRRSDRPDLTYTLPPIYITVPNSDVKIDDPRPPGAEVIGEEVIVCNKGAGPKPRVTLASPDSFDVVKVMLGLCVPPPINMEMKVTRYLRPVIPFNSHEINYY
ncbi:uncharacterized protein [Choristoneura fumiferana]|uniref:uncharacterized protein n=1 Tax=Choristoneura fumiferana TaxID=7141 RepID=UPI003D159567